MEMVWVHVLLSSSFFVAIFITFSANPPPPPKKKKKTKVEVVPVHALKAGRGL